jgi:hypothetical protein
MNLVNAIPGSLYFCDAILLLVVQQVYGRITGEINGDCECGEVIKSQTFGSDTGIGTL